MTGQIGLAPHARSSAPAQERQNEGGDVILKQLRDKDLQDEFGGGAGVSAGDNRCSGAPPYPVSVPITTQ